MLEFPHEYENRKKDMIIARSPILRVFMDDYSEVDPDMWSKILDKAVTDKREEMISTIGEDLIELDIGAYMNMANDYKVYNQSLSLDKKYGITLTIAWMGYEIGHNDDLELFETDILSQMFSFHALKETEESALFLDEVMKCGVLWRQDVKKV